MKGDGGRTVQNQTQDYLQRNELRYIYQLRIRANQYTDMDQVNRE